MGTKTIKNAHETATVSWALFYITLFYDFFSVFQPLLKNEFERGDWKRAQKINMVNLKKGSRKFFENFPIEHLTCLTVLITVAAFKNGLNVFFRKI